MRKSFENTLSRAPLRALLFFLPAAALLAAVHIHASPAAAGAPPREDEKGLSRLEVGDDAPEIILPEIATERRVKVSFRGAGKPTLLLFWYLACPNCVTDMRHVRRIGAANEGRLDVVTVNVDPPKLRGPALNFLKNSRMTPFLNLAETILETGDRRFYLTADRYGVISTPSLFLITREGAVAYKAEKDISFDEVEEAAERLLRDK